MTEASILGASVKWKSSHLVSTTSVLLPSDLWLYFGVTDIRKLSLVDTASDLGRSLQPKR